MYDTKTKNERMDILLLLLDSGFDQKMCIDGYDQSYTSMPFWLCKCYFEDELLLWLACAADVNIVEYPERYTLLMNAANNLFDFNESADICYDSPEITSIGKNIAENSLIQSADLVKALLLCGADVDFSKLVRKKGR